MTEQPRREADDIVSQVFSRLDPIALGVAGGAVSGAVLFAATAVLALKGGGVVGPTLGLLDNYFPGYEVTLTGSVAGLLYGFVSGFALGWFLAAVHNAVLRVYVLFVAWKVNLSSLTEVIDPDHAGGAE
jgi:hypothetical protein